MGDFSLQVWLTDYPLQVAPWRLRSTLASKQPWFPVRKRIYSFWFSGCCPCLFYNLLECISCFPNLSKLEWLGFSRTISLSGEAGEPHSFNSGFIKLKIIWQYMSGDIDWNLIVKLTKQTNAVIALSYGLSFFWDIQMALIFQVGASYRVIGPLAPDPVQENRWFVDWKTFPPRFLSTFPSSKY